MAVFHVVVDLELFGHLPPGTSQQGLWPWFARAVAGTFLFLSGISLWLAHGGGIRWRPFLRRLGVLIVAASGITLVTWLAMPDRFIFFGILHAIAAASVAGLAVLRLSSATILIIAALVLIAPLVLSGGMFDAPALLWLGLSEWRPASMDFVPVFPWLAPCLAGIVAARWAEEVGLLTRLPDQTPMTALARHAAWPGRHSLAIYLVHQPVLLALIWAFGAAL